MVDCPWEVEVNLGIGRYTERFLGEIQTFVQVQYAFLVGDIVNFRSVAAFVAEGLQKGDHLGKILQVGPFLYEDDRRVDGLIGEDLLAWSERDIPLLCQFFEDHVGRRAFDAGSLGDGRYTRLARLEQGKVDLCLLFGKSDGLDELS